MMMTPNFEMKLNMCKDHSLKMHDEVIKLIVNFANITFLK